MTALARAHTSPATPVDYTALRVNQACIILIALLAFLFNASWLAALLCLALVAGTVVPASAPFKRVATKNSADALVRLRCVGEAAHVVIVMDTARIDTRRDVAAKGRSKSMRLPLDGVGAIQSGTGAAAADESA